MRASARAAVAVLGLLLLWAIGFSFAGSISSSVGTTVIWAAGLALAVWALHRALVYSEARGWVYYRHGRGGDGRLAGTAEWLNIYDPSRRHFQEAVRQGEWKRDEDDDGDDPAAGVAERRRRSLER
jgi:hypothetical protein